MKRMEWIKCWKLKQRRKAHWGPATSPAACRPARPAVITLARSPECSHSWIYLLISFSVSCLSVWTDRRIQNNRNVLFFCFLFLFQGGLLGLFKPFYWSWPVGEKKETAPQWAFLHANFHLSLFRSFDVSHQSFRKSRQDKEKKKKKETKQDNNGKRGKIRALVKY
jgi:hypothetical protein